MRSITALRRLASLAVLAYAAWLPAQSFDLDQGREQLVSLQGLWRFHPGDSPRTSDSQPLWAAPDFDDSTWPLLRNSEPWDAQGYPAMSGYGWYRFTVTIPPRKSPTAMLLAPIVTAFEVYVDGRFAGGSGEMPPTLVPSTEFNYHLFPLTQSGSPAARTVHIAIRVWHSPIWATYMGGGPFSGGHIAGDPALIAAEQNHRQVMRNVRFVDYYAYSIAAALIGLAILWLFIVRPGEREYLWFAVMLLAQAADSALNVSKEIYAFPPIPIFDLIDSALAAINIFAALYFFSKVLNARIGIGARICVALVVLSPFPSVLYWPGWVSVPASAALQLAAVVPAAIWIFSLLGKRALAGNLDARLLLIPTLLDIGFYVADNLAILLAQAGWSHMPRILELPLPMPPFTMQTGILLHLFFLLAMLVFLILRFIRARRREVWLAGEFEAARQVQQVLLPDQQDQCPGFLVESIYQPADQVGGDFFQQISDSECGILIVIGDVSGKGLPAAMLVSVLVGAIRAEAAHGTDPVTMLNSLNERMMGRSTGGFTTCLAAHITANGLLTIANAGHLPPYLNGQEMAVPGSLPLGIAAHAGYESITHSLAAGDRLTFVSDGVVEAQSKSRELFGFDRTRAISRDSAHRIAEAARLFGQSDDITVVTVEFSAAAGAAVAD